MQLITHVRSVFCQPLYFFFDLKHVVGITFRKLLVQILREKLHEEILTHQSFQLCRKQLVVYNRSGEKICEVK